MPTESKHPETIVLHAGYRSDPTTNAVAVPIYQTVAYEFDSADHGAALFNLEVDGFRYSRISNPTVAAFEERMASLEGGLGAIAFSSGLAAQLAAVLSLADDDELLDLLYPSGCRQVLIGFENPRSESLRGMDNHGAMHWRGDRNGGFTATGPVPSVQPDGGSFSEQAAFKAESTCITCHPFHREELGPMRQATGASAQQGTAGVSER